MSGSRTVTVECLVDLPDDTQCEGMLTFDVEPGHAGRTYGDPYYCYPAEGPIAEFDRATCGHWATATPAQQAKWEDEACEAAAEADEGAYEDAMERRYEEAQDRAWDRD